MNHRVSIRQTIGLSWERMKDILFRPFSIGKWFTLGFCAWIISLGAQNMGGGGNLPSNFSRLQSTGNRTGNFWVRLDLLFNGDTGTFFSRLAETFNITPLALAAVIGVVVIAVLGAAGFTVLTTWLRFRFEFVFLDNLVFRRAQISAPWKQFKTYAHSLWGNYLLVLLFVIVVDLFLFIPVFAFSMCQWLKRCAAAQQFLSPTSAEIATLIFLAFLFFAWNLVFWLWQFFVTNFLVPVMYRKKMLFKEGVLTAWMLVKENAFAFIKFWLVCILFDILLLIILVLGGFLTCCILFILLIIPVVNTTLLLPYLAFKRYFGVDFLAALDPGLSPYPFEEETSEPAVNA